MEFVVAPAIALLPIKFDVVPPPLPKELAVFWLVAIVAFSSVLKTPAPVMLHPAPIGADVISTVVVTLELPMTVAAVPGLLIFVAPSTLRVEDALPIPTVPVLVPVLILVAKFELALMFAAPPEVVRAPEFVSPPLVVVSPPTVSVLPN